MDFTEQQIEEKYNKVPKSIQEAITSTETAEVLGKIGDEHDLLLDDIDELTSQTGLVMLGLVHPNDFIRNLEKSLEIDKKEAMALAKDVNARIFNPIRQSLMKMNEPKSVLDDSAENERVEKIDRETVLNEIESPKPAPIETTIQNSPDTIVPASKIEPPVMENNPQVPEPQIPTPVVETQENISTSPKEEPQMKGDIVKEKLSGMVHSAKEESEHNENTKDIKNVSKGGQDPYREPIN